MYVLNYLRKQMGYFETSECLYDFYRPFFIDQRGFKFILYVFFLYAEKHSSW